MYADLYGKDLVEALSQQLCTTACFVQVSEPGKLNTINGMEVSRKEHIILQIDRAAKFIINVPCSHRSFVAVRSAWVKAFLCWDLGAVHDCYIAEISKKLKEVMFMGADIRLNEYRSDEYLQASDILRSFSADVSPNRPAQRSFT